MAHVAVIGNRNAGGGRGAAALPMLLDELRRAEHGITLIDEPTAADASAALDAVTAAEAIIACGGDGTVHFTLQAALRLGIPMGIVPAGSGDDAARAIGLPHGRRRRDLQHATQFTVAHIGTSRAVDVIWAEAANGVREAFLGVLGAGFDSRVNARANALTFPPGTAKYVRAMLQEIGSFKPIAYRLEFPDESIDISGMLIAVGNGSTYGGGMKVCPGADVHDGVAEVLVVGEISKFSLLRLFPKVFNGSHIRHPATRILTGRDFVMHAPDQIAYADGERIGPAPVRISVQADAIQIIGAP
jgi:diacylglycerol kinase (ATP)